MDPLITLEPNRTRRARAVERVGIGAFWALVVAIVAARVAYFDPHFGGTIGVFAQLGTALRSALS